MADFSNILRPLLPCFFILCNVTNAASTAPTPISESAPVEIVSAEFGLFEAGDNPNETLFVPSAVVRHRQGQRYGWMIEVRNAGRSLSVREEYVIVQPAATGDISAEAESLSLPALRSNQVSQRQLVPVDGKIYGEWAIGPAEPAGHRRLQVVIEDQAVASFEFDVR